MIEDKVFIKKGLLESVGNLPNWKIRNAASKWYMMDVFNIEDIDEIERAIESQYKIEEVI